MPMHRLAQQVERSGVPMSHSTSCNEFPRRTWCGPTRRRCACWT
ncbi:hypothetical protein [Myxococcus sp. MxC21-1]